MTIIREDHKLTRTEKKGNPKYHYQVRNQNGDLISERKSNREYIAASLDGTFYFGRLDLIGKGSHRNSINYYDAKGLKYDDMIQVATLKEA